MAAALIIMSSLLIVASASPLANYWLSPVASLAPLNHYHSQDGSGSYRYGYTGPHHAKMETRSNGVTQGGYSYIDANGVLQTVAYSADAENGFRVRASNLPQQPAAENVRPINETPEVAAARKRHLEEYEKIAENNIFTHAQQRPNGHNLFDDYASNERIKLDTSEKESSAESVSAVNDLRNPFLLTIAEASKIGVPTPDPNLLKIDVNRGNDNALKQQNAYSVNQNLDHPTSVVPLPDIHRTLAAPSTSSFVLPVVPYRLLHSSLHHTQDSLGQYDYSYVGDTSSKTESRSLDGTTRGAYSYVDANGLLQQVHYIADHNGFRVLATNLPEA